MSLVLLLHPVPALVLWMHCEADNLNGNSLVVGGADNAALHYLHSTDGGKERGGEWLGSGGARRGLGEMGKRGGAMEERGGEAEGFELGDWELKKRRNEWHFWRVWIRG